MCDRSNLLLFLGLCLLVGFLQQVFAGVFLLVSKSWIQAIILPQPPRQLGIRVDAMVPDREH